MDGAPAWKAVAKLVWINGGIADMQYAVGKSWIFWYGIFSAITQSASKYWMSVSARLDKRCQELKWSLWRGRCGSRPLQCFHGINYGFYFYKKILTHDKDTFLTIRPRPRRLLIRKAFSKQAIVPKSLVTATYFTAEQTLTVSKSSYMNSQNIKNSDTMDSIPLLGLYFACRRNRKRPPLSSLYLQRHCSPCRGWRMSRASCSHSPN